MLPVVKELVAGWSRVHVPMSLKTRGVEGLMHVKSIEVLSFRWCCGAAVPEWYRYRIGACLVTSSNPVPLKTRRVAQRCTLNLSRAETSSLGVVWLLGEGVPGQVSSMSLDHSSKLRGPSPKALV
ncbi:uncharacterized protein TNCV_2354151 [Trichonephila clavipes]|nr:uncharacterized protein TNCV_2354151 [Trichonephila clavipes]